MEETLVSFNIAELAKEKGFNEECRFHYEVESKESTFNIEYEPLRNSEIINGYGKLKYPMISAPTQSLLQKWLREVHHIDIEARGCRYAGDMVTDHYQPYVNGAVLNLKKYPTYEEALEFALTEALKLISHDKQ